MLSRLASLPAQPVRTLAAAKFDIVSARMLMAGSESSTSVGPVAPPDPIAFPINNAGLDASSNS